MPSEAGMLVGACHCGAVRLSVLLGNGFDSVRRCNCSYCQMRGAVVASADVEDFKIQSGEEFLLTYRFNTRTVQHFFCGRCGIYTHHQKRSNPNQVAVNVACLDGVSCFDFNEVPVFDGRRHPNDTGVPAQLAGTLRYTPTT